MQAHFEAEESDCWGVKKKLKKTYGKRELKLIEGIKLFCFMQHFIWTLSKGNQAIKIHTMYCQLLN